MTIDALTFSNLIIDDIVLSDGHTMMGTLGGAGTHALVGMRLWGASPGFVAAVGADLDPALRATLERFGVDTAGLVTRADYRTARAWQLFEPDDRRIEIFRTDLDDFERRKPRFEDLPPAYHAAGAIHLQWGSLVELDDLVGALLKVNSDVRLVWEPSPDQLGRPAGEVRSVLERVALFSPDLGEAAAMTGGSEPQAMGRTLLEWGAPLVALRMGATGSLVLARDGGGWMIPAVPPAALVDVTGAGNSYCGGFLVGLNQGLSPLEAALRAAVSASFALEQFGLPDWDDPPLAEAERRLRWARAQVTAV